MLRTDSEALSVSVDGRGPPDRVSEEMFCLLRVVLCLLCLLTHKDTQRFCFLCGFFLIIVPLWRFWCVVSCLGGLPGSCGAVRASCGVPGRGALGGPVVSLGPPLGAASCFLIPAFPERLAGAAAE